jgi:hypothetical protein
MILVAGFRINYENAPATFTGGVNVDKTYR